MDCAIILSFVSKKKILLAWLFFVLFAWQAVGQDCSCPPINTCGCNVGLTKLTVQFTGLIGLTVFVEDEGGTILSGLVLVNGSTFGVESSAGAGQPFVGDLVTIRTSLAVVATINTSCDDPVTIGTSFGDYTVIDGESVGGTPICCEVMETTVPVISGCPSDIVVDSNPSSCGDDVNWIEPTVSDNCDIYSFTSTHNPEDFFLAGPSTIVTYTAEDNYGNVATCSFTVTVNDNNNPVISNCPSDIVVASDASACETIVNWTAPTATDNCTLTGFSTTHNPGEIFSGGTTTVTYTATDAAGNEATCSFDVTVNDETPPFFSGCPADIVVSSPAGSCETDVNWTAPTASDNCAVNSFNSTHNPGEVFSIGTTTVTYTATDVAGNIAACSFDVTVVDDTDPVISGCPADITVSANSSCQAAVNWIEPTVSDNCPVNFTGDHVPGNIFPLGTTTVTYTATDGTGNTTTCSFDVNVVDDVNPVIAGCPVDMVLTANSSCQAVVSWTEPTVSDDCNTNVVSDHASGEAFPLGMTTVTYTATDNAGNSAVCSFNITVVDNTDPVISGCPSDLFLSANSTCQAVANWAEPTASDDCNTSLASDHTPGEAFPLGTTMVTYTATDQSGNVATCTFNVTVVDDTAPEINNCPANMVVSSDATSCGAVVNWTAPNVTDNCMSTPILTSNFNPGDFFGVGTTTTVNYQAEDDVGNISTCSFTVTVEDGTPPQIGNCPADITVSADASSCGSNVSWNVPTATDNCSGVLTTMVSHNPGDFFAAGTTTSIEYTFADEAGNTSVCSFNVTVNDDSSPVFQSCPSDIVISGENICEGVANWSEPTVTDNCEITLAGSRQSGETFPAGVTEVEYIATDVNGNTSSCIFNVIVDNEEEPVVSGCPTDVFARADESGEVSVTWNPPTAVDVCGEIDLNASHEPGELFAVGMTRVEYRDINDPNGAPLCSFDVIVSYEDLAIDIADVITPDGDGINDEWVIGNIEKFSDNMVVIVDRWGSVIYQAFGYNNDTVVWGGENTSGSLVPTGTYYFYVEVEFRDEQIKKTGFLELVQ